MPRIDKEDGDARRGEDEHRAVQARGRTPFGETRAGDGQRLIQGVSPTGGSTKRRPEMLSA